MKTTEQIMRLHDIAATELVHGHYHPLKEKRAALRTAIEELHLDAERYRWFANVAVTGEFDRGVAAFARFDEVGAYALRQNLMLPDALEFRRDQYCLSAAEFSMVLGISRSHYSEVVHGVRDLPIKSVKRAFAIGVPAEVLLSPSPLRGEI